MTEREEMAAEVRAQLADAFAKVREQHRAELRAAEIRGMRRGFEITKQHYLRVEGPDVFWQWWNNAKTEIYRAIAEREKQEGDGARCRVCGHYETNFDRAEAQYAHCPSCSRASHWVRVAELEKGEGE